MIGQDRDIRFPVTLPVTQSRESLCGLLSACLAILTLADFLFPQFMMIGQGKAMGLIADSFQKMQEE